MSVEKEAGNVQSQNRKVRGVNAEKKRGKGTRVVGRLAGGRSITF